MLFPNLILLIPGLALVGWSIASTPQAAQVGYGPLLAYTLGVILIAWAPAVTLAAALKRATKP